MFDLGADFRDGAPEREALVGVHVVDGLVVDRRARRWNRPRSPQPRGVVARGLKRAATGQVDAQGVIGLIAGTVAVGAEEKLAKETFIFFMKCSELAVSTEIV